jgi:hypothetical protein
VNEQERLEAKRRWAKTATVEALEYAILDCHECIAAGVEPDRYRDEIAEYRSELIRRMERVAKARKRRSAMREAMDSIGMVAVRGNLGGRYYE